MAIVDAAHLLLDVFCHLVTLTFDLGAENWHTHYSCPGTCSHQFWFSALFAAELRAGTGTGHIHRLHRTQ